MKKDLTELVFILDKSGSMAGRQEDVVGGFNSIIKDQENDCQKITKLLSKNYKTIVK